MAREPYATQVALLVRLLPIIYDKKDVFALKDGTAINLFYRDLPCLSVDIDLTYLPVQERQASMTQIDETLSSIMEGINKAPSLSAKRITGGGGGATRISAEDGKLGSKLKLRRSPVASSVALRRWQSAISL